MTEEILEEYSDEFFKALSIDENEKLDDEVIICECFCVNAKDIRSFCQKNGSLEVESLRKVFGLGDGCKSCLLHQDQWINKIL